MSQAWEEGEQEIEAGADTGLDALRVTTIHGSKGLEWPVAIPLNTTTGARSTRASLKSRDRKR